MDPTPFQSGAVTEGQQAISILLPIIIGVLLPLIIKLLKRIAGVGTVIEVSHLTALISIGVVWGLSAWFAPQMTMIQIIALAGTMFATATLTHRTTKWAGKGRLWKNK